AARFGGEGKISRAVRRVHVDDDVHADLRPERAVRHSRHGDLGERLVSGSHVPLRHPSPGDAAMTMRARRGMTLMELVIGLAIAGMMTAAGAGAFESLIAHRRVIRDAAVSTERAVALREMIREWLSTGQVQIQQGGGPRGLSRGAPTSATPTAPGMSNSTS